MTASKADRTFDVVVYGSTGFTGGLAAEYLLKKGELPIERWAIAGRDPVKLAELRARLTRIDPRARALKIIKASSDDPSSLEKMCAQTRVVLTTVGPYAKYGEPLVAAAVKVGCDYVDLTGEPIWWKGIIERFDEAARAKGVRIVPCCGFDSMPHDLGALFTARAFDARRRQGQMMHIEAYVAAKGNFSGGTWASALNHFGQMRTRGADKQSSVDSPTKTGSPVRGPTRGPGRGLHRAKALDGKWAVPMPTIDPLVVRRSAKLEQGAGGEAAEVFGQHFRYDHYMSFKDTKMMAATVLGVGSVVALSQLKPTRKLLERLRPSGAGPSEAERAKSWFRVLFVGRAGDQRVTTEVRGGDPGYSETSKMIAEAATCLALDELSDPIVHRGGVLTPATACGSALIDRLVASGMQFRVLERT